MPLLSVPPQPAFGPRLSWPAFFLASGLALAAAPAAPSDSAGLLGRVLTRVACVHDTAQSYALYVPSRYTAEKKWPVIFCFDAGARGLIPVERMQGAAEKYGYIVAGSLNSRNGPWEQNAAAADAMIRDVTGHFSIDRQRIYTAGMSGGARVASSLALSGLAQGVIACGAGFPALPEGIPWKVRFAFFGVAGGDDFNFSELQRLDRDLADRKSPHRFVTFDGGHAWAPVNVLTEGIEWLEVQAMSAGTRPKDPAVIDALLRNRLAAVPATRGLDRWKALQSLVADFTGLADTVAFAKEAAALAATPAIRIAQKSERHLLVREDELLQELNDAVDSSADRQRRLAAELRCKADSAPDSPERRMTRRAIASFSAVARDTVRQCLAQADYERAESYLELGVALRPDQRGLWFDLARARAFQGNHTGALESLEQAAAAGYHDATRAAAEPAFSKLHAEPRFQAALEKMRTATGEPSVNGGPD